MFYSETSRVERRANLQNVELNVVAPNFEDTKNHLTWTIINGVNKLVDGIALKILRDLEYCMNFRSNIIESDWIGQAANGSMSGKTASLLISKQADLMIGHTVPIIKRAEIMEYLQPTSAYTIRAFVNQPHRNDIFVNSFQLSLLLSLGALALLIVFGVLLISWMLKNYGTHYTLEDKQFKSESCMWLTSCISQQGWYTSPLSVPLRGIFITSVLTALVCYAAYAAKIVSVLSVDLTPIKNLTEIYRSGLPLYATAGSVTIKELIMGFQSQEPKLKVLNVPVNLGVFLLFQSPSAFIGYTDTFHTERKRKGISDHRACELHAYPVTQNALKSAMGLPKKSPLRESFNYKIIAMKEKGLIDRYKKQANIINGLYCGTGSNHYRADLGILEVLTAVIIISVGFALCLGSLICECVYFFKFCKITV